MAVTSINPQTVPPPIGHFSQAILTSAPGQHLHISGQIGLRADGSVSSIFAEQAEAAWSNIAALLDAAKMNASNLIKVVTYLTDASYIGDLLPVRSKYLGDARPASTVIVVKSLLKAEWLIEVEAIAFKQVVGASFDREERT